MVSEMAERSGFVASAELPVNDIQVPPRIEIAYLELPAEPPVNDI